MRVSIDFVDEMFTTDGSAIATASAKPTLVKLDRCVHATTVSPSNAPAMAAVAKKRAVCVMYRRSEQRAAQMRAASLTVRRRLLAPCGTRAIVFVATPSKVLAFRCGEVDDSGRAVQRVPVAARIR